MEQLTIQINNMDDVEREIDRSQRKACTSIVEIGYILRKADDAEMYKERGYTSIFTFAKEMYGWDKAQTSRFMAINREYSDGGYSTILKAEYEGFGQAKLSEMLMLPDNIREELSPELKRDDIRDIKNQYKAAEEARQFEEFESSVAPAQPQPEEEQNLLGKYIGDLFSMEAYAKRLPRLWKHMKRYEAENHVDEQSVLMALHDNGCGHARIGGCMFFFRKDEFSAVFGRQKEYYKYNDLIHALLHMSENVELDTPQNWYEKVFGKRLPEERVSNDAKKKENSESPLGDHDSKEDKKDTKKNKKSTNETKSDMNLLPEVQKVEKEDAPDAENNESPLGDQPLPGQSEIGEFAEEMPITYEKSSDNETEDVREDIKTDAGAAVQSEENNESPLGDHDFEVVPDKVDGVCQFCAGNKDIESNDGTFTIHITPSGIGRVERKQGVTAFAIVEFDYCPKCGKELGTDEG